MKKTKRSGGQPKLIKQVEAPDLVAEAAISSFQGADTSSRDRGFVYVPTLDTLKEVDSWSHTELLKRGRFIYNSGGGLIHRGVNGVARMVCGTGLFPYPLSPSKSWNAKVRRLWMQRCESKNTFDLSRKFTCGAAQAGIIRSSIVGGDMAPVLAREEGGRLRCMFYEAHQVGNGLMQTVGSASRWHHGVLLGQHNAPVAYRIISRDPANGKETAADVPADNVLFVANYERFGQVRGLSRFYPVINKVLDRGEIMAALTKGIKMRSQIGWAIEQQMQQQQVQVPGTTGTTVAARPTTMVKTSNGRTVTMEEFFGGGQSMELRPGQTFKTVESAHPHENVREHLENLVRDVAWALGYAPEILWNITQLGGANTRFIMADAQSQIEEEQQRLVEQFLGPWYIAWVRDMIEAGEIEDVDGWDLHTWLLPKRLTVDFGRDGKLHIEQAKRGMITLKSLYGFVGDEWQIEIDQYLDERLYIKEGMMKRGLSWQEAYPELPQINATAPGRSQSDVEDEEDDEEEMTARQYDATQAAIERARLYPAVRL